MIAYVDTDWQKYAEGFQDFQQEVEIFTVSTY